MDLRVKFFGHMLDLSSSCMRSRNSLYRKILNTKKSPLHSVFDPMDCMRV